MKANKKTRVALLAGAVALVAAACSGTGDTAELSAEDGIPAVARAQGDPIPTEVFETFAGETVSLAAYSGRPVVVNFWASWCPSCVAEMSAAFLPAQQELGEQIAFLGVNIQDDRSRALELVEETGVLFDLAEDPDGALYRALGGLGMPFTVFVSADGRVLEAHNGPLTEEQLIDMINEVLL
ncbi:MAG: TlpA disulfide reductase family protein [Acidimicrobiia bacterium]|nr:TlpA disulfide reductase family protein [Acidimicrobiia bacterium]